MITITIDAEGRDKEELCRLTRDFASAIQDGGKLTIISQITKLCAWYRAREQGHAVTVEARAPDNWHVTVRTTTR